MAPTYRSAMFRWNSIAWLPGGSQQYGRCLVGVVGNPPWSYLTGSGWHQSALQPLLLHVRTWRMRTCCFLEKKSHQIARPLKMWVQILGCLFHGLPDLSLVVADVRYFYTCLRFIRHLNFSAVLNWANPISVWRVGLCLLEKPCFIPLAAIFSFCPRQFNLLPLRALAPSALCFSLFGTWINALFKLGCKLVPINLNNTCLLGSYHRPSRIWGVDIRK